MINLEIPGFCPQPQLATLAVLAQSVPPNGSIVEVGCLFGRSAFTWASSSKESVKIYCIDPWDEKSMPAYTGFSMKRGTYQGLIKNTKENFLNNLSLFQNKIVAIQQKSPLAHWDLSVDIVYLDGDHTYTSVKDDIVFWSQFLGSKSIICGDDYTAEFSGLVEAVDEMAMKLDYQVKRLGKLWIYQNAENSETVQLASQAFHTEWLKLLA